jgi:hypothetical protein
MRRRASAALALPLLLSACLRSVGASVQGTVDLAAPGQDQLHLVYLGTGGWIMEHGPDLILTGPLFTNPGLVRTGLIPIRSDTLLVDRYMSRYDVSRALAILVGHAHYDHLMDVPRVALAHAPRARIAGSRTVANTLGTWAGVQDRIDLVNDSAGDQKTIGRWLHYGPRVRVMPLRSYHAPHFDGYRLYRGTRDTPRTEEPKWASDWVDGHTFAFLIDFLNDDGSVAFRVYYQDAVVAPPLGLAPEALIEERPADVAILVPATFDQVEWFPETLIENLRPRRILLGHWEDFFTPVDAPIRSIRLTDLRHFERRLEHVFHGEWWRPDHFREFRFTAR